MQKIDALVMFAKVGEFGSISGAARALGLPKANVSRAVARLEADYGVGLIERSTRRVVLTEIGLKVHEHCVRLMAGLEEVDTEVAAFRGEPRGTLRVGCPATIASYLISWIPDFLARYPSIDLRLKVADRVLPEPYGFDVVLHAGWLADSGLIARKLADLPTILVASCEYVSQHGVPTGPEDLSNHAVIGNYYADPDLPAKTFGELPATVPRLNLVRGPDCFPVPTWHRFASNDPGVLLGAVRGGLAIAPLSLTVVGPEMASGALVRILPEYDVADPPSLYAVHAGRTMASPKVRAFLDYVVERVWSAMRTRDAVS